MLSISPPARPVNVPLASHAVTTAPPAPPLTAEPPSLSGVNAPPARIRRDLAAPPAEPDAGAVHSQFAARPTVRTVVAQLLQNAISTLYPGLNVDTRQVSLATPQQASSLQYTLTPLLDVALDYLANGTEPDFTDKHATPCKLVNSTTAATLRAPSGERRVELDMRKIELAIRSLPQELNAGFAAALSRYWGADALNADPATSRWRWLSDTLNNTLSTSAVKTTTLDEQQRQTLDQVTRYPDSADRTRVAAHEAATVYAINTTLDKAGATSSSLGTDLLITRQVGDRQIILHTTTAGVITPYPSMDAFATAWSQRLAKPLSFDQLTWQRTVLEGNVFDAQAALILNGQLQRLSAIPVPGNGTRDDLQRQFSDACDTSAAFIGAPALPIADAQRLNSTLPAWLHHASDAERFAYQRHTLALARSVQRNHGHTFLDGIADIRTFARQQLDPHLARDGYTAADVEVVFKVAVGTLGGGYIERVRMSLTDMALENLAGLPKGEMDVYVRGERVDDATTGPMLKRLIDNVDIGKHYPALINRELLSDTAKAHEREAQFAEQVPIQLAMQALELKLKGESGLTARGYRYLEAVLEPGAGVKQVDGQEITLRPLAFVRKPGATPDVVDNMFLIEPLDATQGPHLLYRPQLTPPLQEFADRKALLKAIREPGPLQQSILAWLPNERVRAVYGNGGFNIPNIARYGLFNEFDPPATPKPTALAVDGYNVATTLRQNLLEGHLMHSLFNSNAHSLATLAEGQSTSSAESRWASHKELGWLLFNTLLPVLRGPGAMAGWLLQMSSVESDIRQTINPANPDPSAAVVDMLVNMAMVLGHTGAGEQPAQPSEKTHGSDHPDAFRRTPHEPASTHIRVQEAASIAPQGSLNTALDLSFASPRGLSAAQKAQIHSFSIRAPRHQVPPIAEGVTKGLYAIDGKLHALIDNHWYRVARDLDGLFVIDERNKARTGPPIKSNDKGRWDFDLGPKLRGGMPKTGSVENTLKKNLEAKAQTDALYEQSFLEGAKVAEARGQAQAKVGKTFNDYESARKKLRTLWSLANAPESAGRFTAQYEQQLKTTLALRTAVDQGLKELKQLTRSFIDASEATLRTITPKKLGGVDDLSEYKQNRTLEYRGMIKAVEDLEDFHRALFNDSNQYASSGAPLVELVNKAKTGFKAAYDELVEAFKITYRDRETVWEVKQEISDLFEKWKSDSPYGKKQALEMVKEYARPPAIDALVARLGNLTNLKELCINRTSSAVGPGLQLLLTRFGNTSLEPVNRAFMEQREYQGYTLNERKATLNTIIDAYKQSMSDGTFLQETYPTLFRAEYHQLFIKRLGEIIADAEADLADVVREEQHLTPAQPTHKERQPKPQNQRVFNTRDKQTLIGTLRPPEAGRNNIIDVLDPQTGRPIDSYSEHPAEHEWVKITRAQPEPLPQATTPKALATYKNEIKKLIEEGDAIERTIIFQKKKLTDPLRRDTLNPLDWHDMLEAQANKLRDVARKTETDHGTQPEAAAMIARWRNTADELVQKARQHAADGYRVQPPKPENVDFLWRYGFVDINLSQRDVRTKSGDVFTEYAVRDKGKPDVLWYAHFHYAAKGAPRSNYTAAHLKIPSQRTKTQKDLIAEAGNNRVVEQIIRSRITPPLDEKLFLKL